MNKILTQEVFKDPPEWVKSVAVTRAKKYIDCVNLKPFFLTITDDELKFR